MSSRSPKQPPTYYDILRLPRASPAQILAKEAIKAAYHRALLSHHPDKTNAAGGGGSSSSSNSAKLSTTSSQTIDIDNIVAAYETLADPAKRAAYDASLTRGRWGIVETDEGGHKREKGTVHAGAETYDLEDLAFDGETTGTWRQRCRCGNVEGYVLTEAELERESGCGEVFVGCRGCSLFIKVVFGVSEEGVLD